MADFDGDGRLDLVHGPPRGSLSGPRIFRGSPRADFEPWSEASFPAGRYDYGDVAAGDLNGDFRPDLVLVAHLGDLVVLGGEGDGRFGVMPCCLDREEGDSGFSSRAVAIGDLDGDGRADIATLGEGPKPRGRGSGGAYGIRLWLNRGKSPWELRRLQPSEGRLFGDSIALADLDGDGKLDLITGSNVQGQRGVIFWGSGTSWEGGTLEALPEGSYIHAVAATHPDGDAAATVAIAGTAPGASKGEPFVAVVRWDQARASRLERLAWSAADGRPTALAWGDPDGDGDGDLVVLTDAGGIAWFVNDGGKMTTSEAPATALGGRGCRGRSVRLADLDDDGRDEVIAGFADESCAGGGSLRAWKLVAVPPSSTAGVEP